MAFVVEDAQGNAHALPKLPREATGCIFPLRPVEKRVDQWFKRSGRYCMDVEKARIGRPNPTQVNWVLNESCCRPTSPWQWAVSIF
jgi:hypothetical protein